ncbi:hypothetical protein MTBLM5_10136 [Magnetospirillum sp. LM-5]|nr:hypothetical protein MTBLM5_10136 [Magnetospirillum sp. LM-5]
MATSCCAPREIFMSFVLRHPGQHHRASPPRPFRYLLHTKRWEGGGLFFERLQIASNFISFISLLLISYLRVPATPAYAAVPFELDPGRARSARPFQHRTKQT